MEPLMDEREHDVVTVTDGFEYRAECSCGWESEWLADDTSAVLAGVEHPQVAMDPPHPVDGFVHTLLDVQDDLARVVEWVAASWSADLPVPTLWGTAGRRGCPLDVTVMCDTAKQLDTVAALLGARVVRSYDDECLDTTYWYARRRFGRVGFEAWRYQP